MSGNGIKKNCRKSFKGYMRKHFDKCKRFEEIPVLNRGYGVIFFLGGGVFELVTPPHLVKRYLVWEKFEGILDFPQHSMKNHLSWTES